MRMLARQTKLGASSRVKVPVGKGLTIHPYRVLRLCGAWKKVNCFQANKTGEAYTENHASRKGVRAP